jgi:hypothetical protein
MAGKTKPVTVYERPESKKPHTFKTKKAAKEFIFETIKGATAHDMPEWSDYITLNAATLAKAGDDLPVETSEEILKLFTPEEQANLSNAFKSKYTGRELMRFLEAWSKDPIAAAALDLLFQFVLGEYPKTIIDVNRSYMNDDEEDEALKFFSTHPLILKYKSKLDRINKDVDFTENMVAGLNQAGCFGRDVIIKERDPVTKLPLALKVLPAMRLGRQWVHKKKWTLMAVEYLDFDMPEKILKAPDIIHVAMHDYHMAPGTLGFGNSLFERIIDISDLNRIINQIALKEINFRLWAAFLLVQVDGLNKKAASDLVKKIASGKSLITNQATKVEVFQLGHDLEKLVMERIENMRQELNGLQVPELIFRNDVTNRSVSNDVLVSWTQSVLKSYRRWIGGLIQRQWIDDILKTLIMEDMKPSTEPVLAPLSLPEESTAPPPPSPPVPAFGNSENADIDFEVSSLTDPKLFPPTAFDENGQVVVSKLPWKLKYEYVNYNFEVPSEKMKSAILALQAGLYSKTKALETVEAYDEIERLKLEETSQTKLELATNIIDEQKQIIAQPAMPSVDPKTMMQQELSLASASQQVLNQKEALIKKQSEALDKIIQKAMDI